MAGLEVTVSQKGFVVATWQGVLLNAWRQPGTLETIGATRRAIERFARARGDKGYVSISVFDVAAVSHQPEDVREASIALSRDFAQHTHAAAFLIPGRGFAAATTRMVIASVMLLSRTRYPTKTFDGSPEAARWLAGFGAKPPADELHGVIEEVRSMADRV